MKIFVITSNDYRRLYSLTTCFCQRNLAGVECQANNFQHIQNTRSKINLSEPRGYTKLPVHHAHRIYQFENIDIATPTNKVEASKVVGLWPKWPDHRHYPCNFRFIISVK